MRRQGLMKGNGKGYKNGRGKDPYVHSQSARGIKQPQRIPQNIKDNAWVVRKKKGDEFASDITEWKRGDEFVSLTKAKGINDMGKVESFWVVEKGKIRKPFDKVKMRNVFDDKKTALYNSKVMRGEVKW